MKTGIKIGASKGAVKAANAAILDILACGMEQETIRAALKAFTEVCQTNNTMISDCVISSFAEPEQSK